MKKNPNWHAEDSKWKANHIIRMLEKNSIVPETICEVGCGVGEILINLQKMMSNACKFCGYDISPQAIDICKKKNNENIEFNLKDFSEESEVFFDLIMAIDLIEHLENYYDFLIDIKSKSQYKIMHVPLDLSVQGLFRMNLIEIRNKYGHIHYFTKETILADLKGVGYEVIDYFYTAISLEPNRTSFKRNLAKLPRKLLYSINQDFAARLLGGCSLMILAQ